MHPLLALGAALAACGGAGAMRAPPGGAPAPVRLRILALNDFHGQLAPASGVGAPGAVALATALLAAREGYEGRTLILHAGDLVGASAAESALLQDEPSVTFFGLLGNASCRPPAARTALADATGDPRCDLVGAVGNHELDEGSSELRRLLLGGNHAGGPYLVDPWPGARYPTVCANLVDAGSRRPVLPPWVIREVGGVRIGVVGAVRDDLATKLAPSRLAGLAVLPAADAVNRAVAALREHGVRAVVVLLHHGGSQPPYEGWTRQDAAAPDGGIARFVAAIDGEVDAVVTGDAHQFTNALLPASDGRRVLVTQAVHSGRAFALLELEVDPAGGDVVAARAAIRATGGGDASSPAVAAIGALVEGARARVAPEVGRIVGAAAEPIRRAPRGVGDESSLGDLVADSIRTATGAQVAVVNAGGLRTDLEVGPVTLGRLLALLPHGNELVSVRIGGRQLRQLLEQQWLGQREPCGLHVSGVEYVWDDRRPVGDRIVSLTLGGAPVAPEAVLTLAMPAFVADGGDGFTIAAEAAAAGRTAGMADVEALAAHIATLPQPLRATVDGRVRRAGSTR